MNKYFDIRLLKMTLLNNEGIAGVQGGEQGCETSQLGNYHGGCIGRGCKARQAAPDESRKGRLGNYLSLYLSNWFLSSPT